MIIVGKQIVAELYGVKKELILEKNKVKEIIDFVIENSKLNKVGEIYKQFEPYGVTAVVLLAESHLALHIWPEYNLVNLDIFACGDFKKAEKAFDLFLEKLKPYNFKKQIIDRG
jgi:S-adenosylmethionine decarboxylase